MPIEEVPMLSPCPPAAMLSKFFGGKFKYLNRKNSEFLAGNLNAELKNANADAKCRCIMQMQMQNAKCKMQNAKCKCKCKCKCKMHNA